MAEERTLGLARAHETAEEPSKEELQRRLGEARDSISNTVTEIKETVVNQVQAVKDTLDWREQFKKRPVAWSAGALGAGFCLGYCIASYAKGDGRDNYDTAIDRYAEAERSYAAQPAGNSGPGFFQKVASSNAFHRVKDEAGGIGDAVVQELSKTAKALVIPALITSLRNFLGDHLPNAGRNEMKEPPRSGSSSYQPSLERNPS